MRVIYFHQYFSTPDRAIGARSYEFARALIARGHQVTMVCGRTDSGHANRDTPVGGAGKRRYTVDGIDVIELPLRYSNYFSLLRRSWVFFRCALRSTALALREDYDLLFATSTPLTAGIPGLVMKLFRRKPFVFEVRDLWPELPRAMGVVTNPAVLATMQFLEWLSYHASDACIGLSPGIVSGIRKRSPKGHPVAMIPNGCDLHLFQPGRRQDLEIPGVKAHETVAVFTGAHGLANGLDAVLDAAAVLKQRGRTDIRFVFIGDGKLKPILRDRALREGLANCLFLDPIPRRMLANILGCADIGLMILANVPAFYYGTSPNKFFDYLASGLPVLNNYPGWLRDLITEHNCGLGVAPDDPQAFADAMERLTDNPSLRHIMGINARALAESNFARDVLADRFIYCLEDTYARFLGRKSRQSSNQSVVGVSSGKGLRAR